MTYETNITPENPDQLKIERAQAELATFADNPHLISIFEQAGCEIDPIDVGLTDEEQNAARANRLAAMQAFATEHWDARNGIERQSVDWGTKPAEESPYYGQFVQLGMVESSKTTRSEYDFLLVLGAANKAPLQRLQYGLEQGSTYDHIALLGAGRPVGEKESKIADTYAPGAKTEHDLMDGAAKTVFKGKLVEDEYVDLEGVKYYGADHPDYWKLHYFETTEGMPIFSLHSDYKPQPENPSKNRAHTGDTYAFFRATAGDMLGVDSSVALVTNAFYTNAQHLDAVRELTLKTGAFVETIGFSAEYSGVVRKENQLLQETKSAIDAAVRLQQAIEQAR